MPKSIKRDPSLRVLNEAYLQGSSVTVQVKLSVNSALPTGEDVEGAVKEITWVKVTLNVTLSPI